MLVERNNKDHICVKQRNPVLLQAEEVKESENKESAFSIF